MKSAVCLLFITFFNGYAIKAQEMNIGKIVDFETDKPISMATVLNEETKDSTITNSSGYFQLKMDTSHHLRIEHRDYESIRIKVPSLGRFKLQIKRRATEQYVIETDAGWVLSHVDEEPSYISGMPSFYELIATGLQGKYPLTARRQGVEGLVVILFELDTTGTISKTEILQDPGAGCGKAVLKCLEENAQNWKTAMIDGKACKTRFMLPVYFQLGHSEIKAKRVEAVEKTVAKPLQLVLINAMGTPLQR